MTLTPSTMRELGTIAPDFTLAEPGGKSFTLSKQSIDKGLLVIFMCNHCPYVIHIREQLIKAIRRFQTQGITVVAINSNDFSSYPDDDPKKMAQIADEFGYSFPYLVDETQEVATRYRAACTPDLFLFDGDSKLVYRGQFDSARPGNGEPVTGADLSAAVERLLSKEPISEVQKPSMGCNIKWKKGNEPDYFN